MMKNKEIKYESELEQAVEKHRYDDSRFKQLKTEYDELKFQFDRYKIFKDSTKVQDYKYENLYEMANQITFVPKAQGYVPDRYKPLATYTPPPPQKEHIKEIQEPQIDTTTAANSEFSEMLYRKNMASTVGDLLRWDSQKGVYSNNRASHNKVRSVSNPPIQNHDRSRFEPSFY